MKKLFAFAVVVSMAALVSCGGAEDAAKKAQDSIHKADSMHSIQVADSMKTDSMNKATAAAAAAQAKKDDSMKMAAHADSVAKKLIKEPKAAAPKKAEAPKKEKKKK